MIGVDRAPAWRLCGCHVFLGVVVAVTAVKGVHSSKIPANNWEEPDHENSSDTSTVASDASTDGEQASSEMLTPAARGNAVLLLGTDAAHESAADVPEDQEHAHSSMSTDVAGFSIHGGERRINRPIATTEGLIIRVDADPTAAARPTGTVHSTRSRSFMSRILSRLQRWLPGSDHPQARQRTPSRLNRYFLLLIYWLLIAATNGPLYGWRALSSLFISQGSYAGHCSSPHGNLTDQHDAASSETLQPCQGQITAVQTLFSLGCATNCAMCALAGFFYSRFGPRLTGIVGQMTNLSGWVLLYLSSRTFSAHLPAILLMGAAIHFSLFSVFTVRALFPGYESSVLMLFGAAFMISTLMPELIRSGVELSGLSVRQSIGSYIVGVLLPSTVLAASVLPRREFSIMDAAQGLPHAGEERGVTRSSRRTVEEGREGGLEPGGNRAISLGSFLRHLGHRLHLPLLISRRFLLVTLYRAVCNIAAGFYQQAAANMLSAPAVRSFSYILPSGCLFCVAMGYAATRFSIFPLMALVTTAAVLMYALPLLPLEPSTHYISTIFAALYIACYSSQHLSLTEGLFGSQDFSVVAGWSVMLSGLVGASSSALYEHVTMHLLSGNTTPMSYALIALLSMQYVWLFLLWRYSRRGRNVGGGTPHHSAVEASTRPAKDSHSTNFTSRDEDE